MTHTNNGGKPTRTMHLATTHLDKPDLVHASLTANPPPKSKITPQGNFVSTVFQSIKQMKTIKDKFHNFERTTATVYDFKKKIQDHLSPTKICSVRVQITIIQIL